MRTIQAEDIRPPVVAGKFYPGDATHLRHNVEKLLHEAKLSPINKPIIAAVAPHAGYMYSGGVAAHVFKTLQACPSLAADNPIPLAAVISPSHHEAFPSVSVFTGRAYQTPLGEVPVAREVAEALVSRDPHFQAVWNGHRSEHALEVELPFLQVIWPQFRLVPIVMGYQDWELCQLLGEHLAALARTTPMFILASSDLSHYYPYNDAVKIDERFIQKIRMLEPAALHQALESGVCEACGGGPVVAAMIAAKALGADQVDILCYQNSGDVSGDRSAVVGYLAATFAVSAIPHA